MKHLIICASPRAKGRSASLSKALWHALKLRYPKDQARLVMLRDLDINPCTACNACERRAITTRDQQLFCIFHDDMEDLRNALNDCDALLLVSPVFFAGAPAQLKAFLDRLQPYFWVRQLFNPKRPADLYVVGEGGDPHGFGPLVGEVRSAIAVAGFRMEAVHDWVGLIEPDGTLPTGSDPLCAGGIYPAQAFTFSGPTGSYPYGACGYAKTEHTVHPCENKS